MFTPLHHRRVLGLCAALLLFAAACSSSADDALTTGADVAPEDAPSAVPFEEEATEPSSEEPAPEPTDEMVDDEAEPQQPAGDTVTDIAVASGQFPTLVAALQATGLDGALAGNGPFTVFAPTEEAFAAAAEGLGLSAEELLASPDLVDILRHHVVPGNLDSPSLAEFDGSQLDTSGGGTLTVVVGDGAISIGGAMVVQPDLTASNGVIHVIDTVLLP